MKEQYSDFLFEKGYVLQDKIGEGMEGQVYQAHAAHDASKKYAIKIQEKFTSGEVLLRLLDHPNIVKFHEKLIHPELLTNCIVLDYVQGRTLLDFISDERPSLPQLKAVMLQICKAVNYMHQNEIVHRDLKLENILITDKGQVKLIDFGLAVNLRTQSSAVFCGSVDYIAPELLSSYHFGMDTTVKTTSLKKCDVWSLGIVFFALLVGYFPFGGDSTAATFRSILFDELPAAAISKAKLPSELKMLLLRLLEKDPSFRPSMQQITKTSFYQRQLRTAKSSRSLPSDFHSARCDFQTNFEKTVLVSV